jgi:hypothetical protein
VANENTAFTRGFENLLRERLKELAWWRFNTLVIKCNGNEASLSRVLNLLKQMAPDYGVKVVVWAKVLSPAFKLGCNKVVKWQLMFPPKATSLRSQTISISLLTKLRRAESLDLGFNWLPLTFRQQCSNSGATVRSCCWSLDLTRHIVRSFGLTLLGLTKSSGQLLMPV